MQPTSHQSSPERSSRTRVRTRRVATPPQHSETQGPGVVPVRSRHRLRLNRKLTHWEWLGFGLSVVACILLWPLVLTAHGKMAQVQEQVAEKQTHLDALERQRDEEKGRLAHLKSDKGREQLLVERGYLKPGDRFLLFPGTPPKSSN